MRTATLSLYTAGETIPAGALPTESHTQPPVGRKWVDVVYIVLMPALRAWDRRGDKEVWESVSGHVVELAPSSIFTWFWGENSNSQVYMASIAVVQSPLQIASLCLF